MIRGQVLIVKPKPLGRTLRERIATAAGGPVSNQDAVTPPEVARDGASKGIA